MVRKEPFLLIFAQLIMNLRNSTIILDNPFEDSSDTERHILKLLLTIGLTSLYSSDSGEIINNENENVFDTTVGNEEVVLATHTLDEYQIPKPIYMDLSSPCMQLSFAFEKDARETYDFYFKNVIIEYVKDYSQKSYVYANYAHSYQYFDTYVSVGIPTERYNWFLKQAEKLTSLEISRNSLNETNGYTWVAAESNINVECCIYSRKYDQLVLTGYLYGTLQILESNVVGTSLFHISIVKSTIDQKYFLKFEIKKFQLIDKTDISSTIKETVDKTEPPEELMAKLNLTN